MKCFSIKMGEIVEGIPNVVPHDPSVKSSKGLITEAEFLIEAPSDDEYSDFKEMLTEDLSAGSELVYCELVKPDRKKKHKYILVAYHPEEYRTAPECGDCSDVIIRSEMLFVIRAPKTECFLFPIGSSPSSYYFTIVKGKLVKKKITKNLVDKMERKRIEQRRNGYTTLYQF